MHLEPSIQGTDHVYRHIVDALRTDRSIVYSKVNHGFWEQLVAISRAGFSYTETDSHLAALADKNGKRPSPYFVETGFVSDILDLFQQMPQQNPNYIFSAGLHAWPNSDIIQGRPTDPNDSWQKKIDKYIPAGLPHPHADGIEFKRAIVNGSFKNFADIIARKDFVFVGNKHIKTFTDFIGADNSKFVEIHPNEARKDRHKILDAIGEILETERQYKTVLLQSGGSLSAWLILKLYQQYPKHSYIDLGRAPQICNPSYIFNSPFGKAYRRQILASINAIHPGWFEACEDNAIRTKDPRRNTYYEFRTGTSAAFANLYQKVGVPLRTHTYDPDVPINKPIAFIENKKIDSSRLNDFLKLSLDQNHHANRGPVSNLLERCLQRLLKLPPHRKVVMCSSCTAGIHIAAGVHAINAGKPLSWIASAFGFMSSNIGPMSKVELLDCNAHGHLDVASLAKASKDYEGVLYTSSFARNLSIWEELREHCIKTNKKLIIDNAIGLLDRPESSHATGEIEVVSCHHTKPWGVGEGGFLIVDAGDEKTARSLINFGVKTKPKYNQYAHNAKISDLACAAILDRLERMPHWSFYYTSQVKRLRNIIQNYIPELTELSSSGERKSPVTNLQFLAPHAIPLDELDNEHFVMRKYYRPLISNNRDGDKRHVLYPNASALYARMINIPVHPFMRNVSAGDIVDVLRGAISKRGKKA